MDNSWNVNQMILNYTATTILQRRKKRQNLLSKKKTGYANGIEFGKHHATVTTMKLVMMIEMKITGKKHCSQ